MADHDLKEENWIRERLCAVEEHIRKVESAVLALSTGATSYTIDTGQTRQTVTKAGLSELKNSLAELENRRAVLKSQLEGRQVNLQPGW